MSYNNSEINDLSYDKAIELYKLLINHAGGNDKKLYSQINWFK